MIAKDLKLKDWVELGKYKDIPILWRVAHKEIGLILMSEFVIMEKCFDTMSKEHKAGLNIWRDSTLRCWLNSSSKKVDFGKHPKPSAENIRKGKNPYDKEPGFLSNFTKQEQGVLEKKPIENVIHPIFKSKEKIEITEDYVFILNYGFYEKIPIELRNAKWSEEYLKDKPYKSSNKAIHWSRTPHSGESGLALLDFWSKEWMETNSGAYCSWGIRPCVFLKEDLELTGKGTQKNPYRVKFEEK